MKKRFYIEGMTCHSCVQIITKQAMGIEGVRAIRVHLAKGEAVVDYDETVTDEEKIFTAIEERGYPCFLEKKTDYVKTGAMMVVVAGIMILGYFLYNMTNGMEVPTISQGMSYGLLFLVGLLTGFHCIAMCGGFVVSYTAKNAQSTTPKKNYQLHAMYGIGKTVSYTIIGAGFGLIGSIIAFTPMMRGVVGVLAGIFLILFGIKMLGIFPWLKKFQLKSPGFVYRLTGKNSSPLYMGLLNGLMIACGPLQAIYIMAAGTGSAIEGAKLLFVFGLGTLPVMLGFGYLTSIISSKMTHKILKASGVIVLILGVIMVNRGLALTGTGYDARSIVGKVTLDDQLSQGSTDGKIVLNNGYQEIRMTVDGRGWTPDRFVLQKDIPVKWIIDGKDINGCNNAINVPKYDLEFQIKKGEQVIEFTPTETGVVPWSCWMGMIPGTFIVVDGDVSQEEIDTAVAETPRATGGSCGMGCGCGG